MASSATVTFPLTVANSSSYRHPYEFPWAHSGKTLIALRVDVTEVDCDVIEKASMIGRRLSGSQQLDGTRSCTAVDRDEALESAAAISQRR